VESSAFCILVKSPSPEYEYAGDAFQVAVGREPAGDHLDHLDQFDGNKVKHFSGE
jgi:hypothetical protein